MRLCYGLLLIILAACGSGTSSPANPPPPPPGPPPPPPPPPAPGTVSVTISDYQYTPDTIRISVGTPVRWTNQGTVSHTATADGGAFNSGTLGAPGVDGYGNSTPGATYDNTFTTAAAFASHGAVHPFMRRVVIVTP